MFAAQAGSVKTLAALIAHAGAAAQALVTAKDDGGNSVMAYALPVNNFQLNEMLWAAGAEMLPTPFGERNINVLMAALEQLSAPKLKRFIRRSRAAGRLAPMLAHRDNAGLNIVMYAIANRQFSFLGRLMHK